MKKNIIIFLIICFLFITNIYGCWVAFTPEEMIQEAEIIAIVRFLGQSGVDKSNDVGNTLWNVEVQYYLKGELNEKHLIISTPGIKNSIQQTSIDYFLSDYNEYMLIFLNYNSDENKLTPVTPFGIVNLVSTSESYNSSKNVNENILSMYSFESDSHIEEDISEFKNFVSNSNNIVTPTVINDIVKKDNITLYVLLSVCSLLVITFLIVKYKIRKGV